MDWPHSPPHRFDEAGTYFITAATLLKQHIFNDAGSKDALQKLLFTNAREYDCWLQAWAIFSNHYHLVVQSQDGPRLRKMLARLHSQSAIDVNRRHGLAGRKVWFQFWDTQLTFERSWLARLRYTHENAVHHRLVADAQKYPWCSAGWFERTAPSPFVRTVQAIKIDRVNVRDDF